MLFCSGYAKSSLFAYHCVTIVQKLNMAESNLICKYSGIYRLNFQLYSAGPELVRLLKMKISTLLNDCLTWS